MAGLVLQIDPNAVVAGAAKAKSALDTVAASAGKAEAALKKAGAGGTAIERGLAPASSAARRLEGDLDRVGSAATRTGRAYRGFGSSLQNVGFQINDFAVQVGAGTSATQALGQQLPQLLQGFGLWGVALSVVVAAGIPLAGMFFSAGDSAKSFADASDYAADKLDGFRTAIENASLSADEMKAKFGSAFADIQAALDAIANQKAVAAQNAINGVTQSLAAMMGTGGDGDRRAELASFFDVNIFLAFTDSQRRAREEARLLTAEFVSQQDILAGANGDLELQLSTLQDMYSTTIDLANETSGVSEAEQTIIDQIGEALNQVAEQVELTRTLAAETGEVETKTISAGRATAAFSDAISSAADYMADVVANAPGGGWLSGAIGDVSALAAKAWEAARGMAAARGGVPVSGIKGGRGTSPGGPDLDPNGFRGQLARDATRISTSGASSGTGSSGGASGGGGGKSASEKAAEDYTRLIESLDPAIRKSNDLADAQKTLDAALKAGAITTAEAARATELLNEKYGEANTAAEFWKDTNTDLKDAFLDMAVTGVSSFDQIKDSIKRAALEALLFKTGPLAGMFGGGGGQSGGGFLGGLFGGFFGGGGKGLFAGLFDRGGTIGMGQFGIVGENGPEIVRSTPSGSRVTSRSDTARMMAGGGGGQVEVIGGDMTLTDDGKIMARMQVVARQSAMGAVQQVKQSLGGWSQQLQTDGALL